MIAQSTSSVKVCLRFCVIMALVAGGVSLMRPQSEPASPFGAVAAAPQQATNTPVELGNGFRATTDGNATVITTPCGSGTLARDSFPWAPSSLPEDFQALPPLGTISNFTYRFTSPTPEVLAPVYRFGCKKEADLVIPPAQTAQHCLTLSQQSGAIKPAWIACPIDTFTTGEGEMDTPELQLATRVGTTNLMDGVGGRMGLAGCTYGDIVTLTLNDKTVTTAPVYTGHDHIGETNFVLPLLPIGSYTVRTTCTYSRANKPAVAQKGACISFEVAAGTITSLKQCPGGSGLTGNGAFALSTNTTLTGVCGGYGFVAQTTSANGVAKSLVATVKANQGDMAEIAVPAIDPTGFVVANCYTNLAATELGPLECYQVGTNSNEGADPNELVLQLTKCPFTTVRTIETL